MKADFHQYLFGSNENFPDLIIFTDLHKCMMLKTN